jgi:hypothetical protein
VSGQWQTFDLSRIASGGRSLGFVSEPFTLVDGANVHVYAPSAGGHLLEFFKVPNPTNWVVNDLTSSTGHAVVGAGASAVHDTQAGVFHVLENEAGCTQGATRQVACGMCNVGTATETCGSDGLWGPPGTCNGQGVCSPGATRSEACSDVYGDPGTETDSCSGSCQWSAGPCVVCSPGAQQGCLGACAGLCPDNCNYGTQTCNSSGTWGACIGASCAGGGGPCDPSTGICGIQN